MLNSKERILYILSLVFLASILGYVLFAGDEDYVQDYNSQINNLENKIDSLHGINSTLNTKIKNAVTPYKTYIYLSVNDETTEKLSTAIDFNTYILQNF